MRRLSIDLEAAAPFTFTYVHTSLATLQSVPLKVEGSWVGSRVL